MSDSNENVIEFLRNQNTATVCFCQPRFANRVKSLAEKFPDEVKITAENKDGSIVAHIPTDWVKINPPRPMSEERRAELAERFRRLRLNHKASNDPKSNENQSVDKIST